MPQVIQPRGRTVKSEYPLVFDIQNSRNASPTLLVFVNRDDSPVLHGKGRLIEPYELPLAWSDPGFTVAEPDAHMRDKAPLQYQIKTHLRTAGPANNKELAKVFGKSEPGIANATRKL
ncbi:MAG TPA: hypothetical protein QF359_12400, partial [Rhodospirillales bacterium]|nr:hypothetical protein [Rhodospirillales bacterium]